MRILLLLILLTSGLHTFSQDLSIENLKKMEDETLLTLFSEVEYDSIKAEKVANVYLNRAKQQNDTIKIARGYDRLARIYHSEKNIKYADSIIELTKELEHITYPAMGIILKAYNYYYEGNTVFSTKYFLEAYDFAVNEDNISQQIDILHYLIELKSYWGNKEEALELQSLRHKLINDTNLYSKLVKSSRKEYKSKVERLKREIKIRSYFNFVICYYNLNKTDSALFYLKKAEILDNKYLAKSYSSWIEEFKIDLFYQKGYYYQVIENSEKLLSDKLSNYSRFNILINLGLSFDKINNLNKAHEIFKAADSIYDLDKIKLLPNQRVLHQKLYEYSKNREDQLSQIHYLNKLVYTDSIHKIKYKFFEPDMIRKFERPRLLKEKEAVILDLQEKTQQSRIILWVCLGILSCTTAALLYYFKRQLIYKKRFNALNINKEQKALSSLQNETSLGISKTIETQIVKRLEEFEEENEFLASKINLNELSKRFGTNSNYLSKVINLKKKKNFSQYVNDLRADYALEELRKNKMFRKYTIKAIARECGFNTAESFNKAFYKRCGIYPSYFIKQLKKEM